LHRLLKGRAVEYKVGQEVFIVLYGNRVQTRPAIVTKVARKWATLASNGDYRVDIATHELDGGRYSSIGRVYSSEAEYQAEQALKTAWSDLRKTFYNVLKMPQGITVEDIEKARKILRV
jgi:hypothetical protein